MTDVFDNKQILPKLWLQYIAKYWTGAIPSGYPASSSEFSVNFEDDIKDVITLMEENLTTESSIIAELIPENSTIGSYLGVFDVIGEANVDTLLSPVKVPNDTIDVIAMHYNTEDNFWEKIESAHVVDGYVFGEVESFSPIAVFAVRRDTFVSTEIPAYNGKNVYVANGIPVVVKKNEEDATVIVDAYGKSVEVTGDTIIIGGTVDGTDIESTSICVLDATNISKVYGGSLGTDDTTPRVNEVSVKVSGVQNTALVVSGACYRNKVNNLNISVTDSKVKAVGNGNSIVVVSGSQKDSCDNTKYDLLNCNEYVKNSNIIVKGSEVTILYGSSNNGYAYTQNASLTVIDSKAGYLSCAGSNGRTDNVSVLLDNCKIDTYFQTLNRGTVGKVNVVAKNVSTEAFAVLGSNDSDIDGSIEEVKIDINGENTDIVLYAGKQDGEAATYETVQNVVKYVKISRSSKYTYAEGSEEVLRDKVISK